MGVEVHLVDRGALPLRGFDQDVRAFLAEQLAEKGIRHHTLVCPQALSRCAADGNGGRGGVCLQLHTGETLTADQARPAAASFQQPRSLYVPSSSVRAL